jgi:hypothetical protein
MAGTRVGGQRMTRDYESLMRQDPPPAPGAIYALALAEGISLAPGSANEIRFGRNRPQVEVCVGEDDLRVSRQHGLISRSCGRWQLANTGQLPIRLPQGRWLFGNDEPIPLAVGYTPLFVRGSRGREHLLELYVIGPNGESPRTQHTAVTHAPRRYWLDSDERLVLVILGQRYLAQDAFPQPLTRQDVADQMNELRADRGWDAKKVDRTIADVRGRLDKDGVTGLRKGDLPEPIGNLLNHNLIEALMSTATLTPSDLILLDGWD